MSRKSGIVRRPDARGGSPTIGGTRIAVTDIVRIYRMYLAEVAPPIAGPPELRRGRIVVPFGPVFEEIRNHLPHLSSEQITAALAYWGEHPAEIADELDEEDAAAGEAKSKYSVLP